MSTRSVRRAWLDRGRIWSFQNKAMSATSVAPPTTGRSSRPTLMPLAFIAVISLSAAKWLNVYSTATSTAIGSVIATMKGIESANTSNTMLHGNPLPTKLPNCFAT